MAHLKDNDAPCHKKFNSSFYVHKKFGAIKLKEARKRKSELEAANYRSSVEILEVILINSPKRTKLDESTRPANTFSNSQHRGHKAILTAAEVRSQRKTKEMKIAPRPPKIQKSTTNTPSSPDPENKNINAKSKKIKAKLQPPDNVSIAPITIATVPLMPQITPVMQVTSTTPSTSAKSTSPFPSASTIANFNQTPPLSPVYSLANNYHQPVLLSNFDNCYGWYKAQPKMQLNFTTPAETPFCQPPMFYTHMLQRQMLAMAQRQIAVEKREVSMAV